MTDDPSDDDIEALLREERNRPDEPPERVEAIRLGALAKIAALGPGPSGSDGGPTDGGAGGHGPTGSGSPLSGVATSSTPLLSRVLGASSLGAWLVRAGIFTAGVASGFLAHEVLDSSRTRSDVAVGTAPPRSGSPLPPVEGAPPAAPPSLLREQPSISTDPAPSSGAESRVGVARGPGSDSPLGIRTGPRGTDVLDGASSMADDDATAASNAAATLAEERRLLETARGSLQRREAGGALEVLEEHRRRFAAGRLSEEREALAVRALAMAGRVEEARARAASFRARYPRSLLTPVVDRAVPPTPTSSVPETPRTGPEAADPE